jgi:hypothetical protein
MAGSARDTAVLDANTLYPAPVRDLLLSLAVDGLYHARWTRRIHEEWTRNLVLKRAEVGPRLAALVELTLTLIGIDPPVLSKTDPPRPLLNSGARVLAVK